MEFDRNGKNPWLQVVRAIAAVAVMCFHFSLKLPAGSGYDAARGVFFFGFIGVDIFFVLSGFVVAQTALQIRSLADTRMFLLRRFGRIFGAYWPILIFAALLTQLGIPAVEPNGLGFESVFLLDPKMENHLLPVAYTLVYELWFYLATGIAFAWAHSVHSRRRVIIGAIIVLLVWHTAWAVFDHTTWREGKAPLPFILSGLSVEYLAGALLAMLPRLSVRRGRLMLFGGMLLVCAVLALPFSWHYFGLTVVRAVGAGSIGLAMLMMALAMSGPDGRDRSAPRILVRIGDASFSLYLLHVVVLAVAIWLADLLGLAQSAVAMPAVLACAFIISLTGAHVWFLKIEQPIYRQWCRLLARYRQLA